MKLLLTIAIFCSLNAAGQNSHIFLRQMHSEDITDTLLTNETDTTFIHHYQQGWTPCPHIYVAVLQDTVVWDKKPKPLSIGYSFTDGAATSGMTFTDPKPTTQKIVCILCHKVTEQQIKIINEPKK